MTGKPQHSCSSQSRGREGQSPFTSWQTKKQRKRQKVGPGFAFNGPPLVIHFLQLGPTSKKSAPLHPKWWGGDQELKHGLLETSSPMGTKCSKHESVGHIRFKPQQKFLLRPRERGGNMPAAPWEGRAEPEHSSHQQRADRAILLTLDLQSRSRIPRPQAFSDSLVGSLFCGSWLFTLPAVLGCQPLQINSG